MFLRNIEQVKGCMLVIWDRTTTFM